VKILTVVGARPQFIKAGNLSREIKKYRDIQEVIIHTGQHYDSNMSDIFFNEMKLKKPKYLLNIGGKSHGEMTGDMIREIEKVALQERPDILLVYGDTNSTLAGALVGAKLHIPIAHVEAGLRSFNMKMAEEVNRVLTDRVSRWLFCPTNRAVENLKQEGFENFKSKIVKSGDIMYDGALFYKRYAKRPKNIDIRDNFILCTIHRAENTDNPKRVKEIFKALEEIAKKRQIILPLHPRTKKVIESLKLNTHNLTITNPLGYLEMVWLIENSKLIITDSGGLQKEAFFFKKPCITLRDETEWIELVENGFNILVGSNRKKILKAYKMKFEDLNFNIDLYGKGDASKKIIEELLNG